MKPTIAIAGATGFIGRWFIERYKHKYHIVALSRKIMQPTEEDSVEWRVLDMYSLSSTTAALKGADYALYLVHSMQPSTRLNQGSFEDTDLLLADNFARAAEANNLKQIIFLGGILPEKEEQFSRHLRSRFEVEQTLKARSVPLTSLRAGIIVGPGGSSFRIVEKLVNRLPVMISPKWTLSKSQPISLRDTLRMIDDCLGNEAYYDQALDIGGKEVMTYVNMMKTTAELMGKKRRIFPVPIFSIGLSKLWVALFSDSSTTLVSPLIESLRHDLIVSPNPLMEKYQDDAMSFEKAVRIALENKDNIPKVPYGEQSKREKNTVRSVQRLPNPFRKTATWVAEKYQEWLPRFFRYLINVSLKDDISTFYIMKLPLLKLKLISDRSDEDRQLFYIMGGFLVKRTDYGWLEFRRLLNGKYVIAAIHEFVPTLPWFIYVLSQAQIHLWVMKRYAVYLRNMKEVEASSQKQEQEPINV